MELTEQQKDTVRKWVREGASLSEVQKRLTSELGVSMTYMDVRFLVIDLGVEVRNKPEPQKAPPAGPPEPTEAAVTDNEQYGAQDLDEDLPPAAGAGRVKVDVDRIMKAGAVVSGSVTFSDGVSGTWSLDHYGRLALSATPGYQPGRDDIMAFQAELQQVLRRQGY